MFDREFFETVLIEHVNAKRKVSTDGTATVKVQLTNAESYTVLSIGSVHDGYVVLEVLSEKGKVREQPKDERKLGAPPYEFDRLAVPFGTIAYVRVATLSQEDPKIGFK